MPISINYDHDKNVLYSEAAGVITIDDIMEYYSSLATLDLRPDYRVLADYRNADLKINYDDMCKMTQRRRVLSSKIGKILIAVVASRELVFGMARMYQSLLDDDHYEVHPFKDINEAKTWLGL